MSKKKNTNFFYILFNPFKIKSTYKEKKVKLVMFFSILFKKKIKNVLESTFNFLIFSIGTNKVCL